MVPFLVFFLAAEIGAGNARAVAVAAASPLVQSSLRLIDRQIDGIQDASVRHKTADAIRNPKTCVASRAHLTEQSRSALRDKLLAEGFVSAADPLSGIFPGLIEDGSACPHLPQPFGTAPGSGTGSHHSYPGGLAVHEAFNSVSAQNFARGYQRIYGEDLRFHEDVLIAAPLWHDWAKTYVYQWNADGAEFQEITIAGTPAHHVLGLAEAMARGLPQEFIYVQACSHVAPSLGNEKRVADWIRAAAILAQVDVSRYLPAGHLPPLRAENVFHNLSDADFPLSVPAVVEMDRVLKSLAPRFGFQDSAASDYNWKFRHRVLSHFSAERLFVLYSNGGARAVEKEIAVLFR